MQFGGCEIRRNGISETPERFCKRNRAEHSSSSNELRQALRSLNQAHVLHKRAHSTESKAFRSIENVAKLMNYPVPKAKLPHLPIEKRRKSRDNKKCHKTASHQSVIQNLSKKQSKDSLMERESIASPSSVKSRLSTWMSKLFSRGSVTNSVNTKQGLPPNPLLDRADQYIQHNSIRKNSFTDPKLSKPKNFTQMLDREHSLSSNQIQNNGKKPREYNSWEDRPVEETGENENFGRSKKAKTSKMFNIKNPSPEPSPESAEPVDEESSKKKKNKKHHKQQMDPKDEPPPTSGDLEQLDQHDVRQIPMMELQSFQAQPVDPAKIAQNTHMNSVMTANAMDQIDEDSGKRKHKRSKKANKGEGENHESKDRSKNHKSRKHRSKRRDSDDLGIERDEGKQAGDDLHNEKRSHKRHLYQETEDNGLQQRRVAAEELEWDNSESDGRSSKRSKRRKVYESDGFANYVTEYDNYTDNKGLQRQKHNHSTTGVKGSRHKHRRHRSYDRYDASDSRDGRSTNRMRPKYSSDMEEWVGEERSNHSRRGRHRHHHHRHRKRNYRHSRCDPYEERKRSLPPRIDRRCSSSDIDDEDSRCHSQQHSHRKQRSFCTQCCKCSCNCNPRANRPDGELLDALSEVCSELSSRLGENRLYSTRDTRAIRQLRTPKLGSYLSPETLNLLDVLDSPVNYERLARRYIDYGLPPRAPKRRASDPGSDHLTCPCSGAARSRTSIQQQPTPLVSQPPVQQPSAPQPNSAQPTPTLSVPTQPVPQPVQPTTQIITPVLCPVAQPSVQPVPVSTPLPTASWYPTPVPAAPPTNVIFRSGQLILPPPPQPATPPQSTLNTMSSMCSPYIVTNTVTPTMYPPNMFAPNLAHYHR